MFWEFVLAVVGVNALVGIVIFLGRDAILNRLTKSVQHEYDKKLAKLNADLRQADDLLRADIHAKEGQIEALRSGALSAMASRQQAVDKRRLEAIDQLWSGVSALAMAKGAVAFMAVLKFDKAAEESAKNPKARAMFEQFATPFDPTKLSTGDASKARPFVSPLAWALFSAYSAIHGYAVLQLYILKSGLNVTGLMDDGALKKLIATALPDYNAYVEQHGITAAYLLVEELENRLLAELVEMTKGKEFDNDQLERAAEILKASNELRSSMEKADQKVPVAG